MSKVLALIFGAALCLTIRYAFAEWLSRSDLSAATRIEPSNTSYLLALAGRGSAAGDRELQQAWLERVIRVEPRMSAAWLELAHLAESEGDVRKAERRLRTAMRVDRQFAPVWAATNFYFRNGPKDEFWRTLRTAADLAPEDPWPIFRLAHAAENSPARVLDLVVPNRPGVLHSYLEYLLANGLVVESHPVALRIAAGGRAKDRDLLLAYCDLALHRALLDHAINVWNRMAATATIGKDEIIPDRRPWIGNASSLVRKGFGWRMHAPGTIGYGGVRVDLDGSDRRGAPVLDRIVLTKPGADHTIRISMDTEARVRVHITEPGSGRNVPAVQERPGLLRFSAPGPSVRLVFYAESRAPVQLVVRDVGVTAAESM